MDYVVNLERGYIDVDRFGQFERQAFDFDLADQWLENSTIDDTGRASYKPQRYFDANRLAQVDFIKVGVEDLPRNRRPLDFLQNDVFLIQLRGFRGQPDNALAGRG